MAVAQGCAPRATWPHPGSGQRVALGVVTAHGGEHPDSLRTSVTVPRSTDRGTRAGWVGRAVLGSGLPACSSGRLTLGERLWPRGAAVLASPEGVPWGCPQRRAGGMGCAQDRPWRHRRWVSGPPGQSEPLLRVHAEASDQWAADWALETTPCTRSQLGARESEVRRRRVCFLRGCRGRPFLASASSRGPACPRAGAVPASAGTWPSSTSVCLSLRGHWPLGWGHLSAV